MLLSSFLLSTTSTTTTSPNLKRAGVMPNTMCYDISDTWRLAIWLVVVVVVLLLLNYLPLLGTFPPVSRLITDTANRSKTTIQSAAIERNTAASHAAPYHPFSTHPPSPYLSPYPLVIFAAPPSDVPATDTHAKFRTPPARFFN